MEVFRISGFRFAKSLSASGASNRWNRENQYVIYCSQSRSLATLENMAHLTVRPAIAFETMVISIGDDESLFRRIRTEDLPDDWRMDTRYPDLQAMGSEWYTRNETLVLEVPSAIIPQESNFLLNTRHPAFAHSVRLTRNEPYFWDDRLF